MYSWLSVFITYLNRNIFLAWNRSSVLGLDFDLFKAWNCPVLGICLTFQLLFTDQRPPKKKKDVFCFVCSQMDYLWKTQQRGCFSFLEEWSNEFSKDILFRHSRAGGHQHPLPPPEIFKLVFVLSRSHTCLWHLLTVVKWCMKVMEPGCATTGLDFGTHVIPLRCQIRFSVSHGKGKVC